MLSPYRVLDLTDERGQLAGAMLAQLGAEVIAIEPPEGTRSRRLGPFIAGDDGPDSSLRHRAYNRGKKSVVLDLHGSDADRDRLRDLVRGADVLLESADDGVMEALGLGYEHLAELNPALVYTSISAFGRTGPKAHWPATDLTVWAAAGPAHLTGDSQRAPLRTPGGQAFTHGSAEAVTYTLAAMHERASSGLGQHVDASAQQASAQATQSMILAVPNGDEMPTREAGGIGLGGIFLQLLWSCADGHVSVTFLFGTAIGPATDRLMQIVHGEGFCDEATRNKDWVAYGELLFSGEEPVEEFDRVKRCVGEFCRAHTKAELLELALSRGLLIAPVNMIDDVVNLKQLAERDYWDEVGGVRYPGPFAKLSRTPMPSPGAAPSIGAHTGDVLAEPPRTPTAPAPVTPVPSARPLEGVKILDFMWVMAGPAGTRVLADLGATVVRIESNARIETARTLQPFKNGENALETSMLFANMNAGKLDFTVNPTTEEGKAVIHDLVRWADVVTESFSPRAMRGFGLDYETLCEVNPGIIMLSSCLFGHTGPLAEFAGYGTMAAAMSGFFGVTGWPDAPPTGPFGAYTDYISPRFANAVLLAALDHRRRTGQGQFIDFAQAEGALHALAPMILDFEHNGHIARPIGNDDPDLAPHGIFPAVEPDRWIAIACRDDADRSALAELAGGTDSARIEAWTSARPVAQLESELIAAGVAAHRVNDATIVDDPQLVAKGHFVAVPHAVCGDAVIEGPRVALSRTPASAGAAPTLGEHNTVVLTEILGYDDERMVELLISGVLE